MTQRLKQAGMQPAGRFGDGAFELGSEWRRQLVVYAWVSPEGRIVRVGIACAKAGMQARYASYNRWLAGRFKPSDEREQKVSALFREVLRPGFEVWAVGVASKSDALTLEKQLRQKWAETLDLDLMVRGSWVKQQMNAWRASRAGASLS